MKPLILLIAALFLFALTSNAQQTNKVDASVNKANAAVNSANNSVNNASASASNAVTTVANTGAQAKALGTQVSGLFGGGKKLNTTVIKVPGATLGKLKKILAGVKDCPGVDAGSVTFVCDDNDQSITVNHKGKTNELLDALEKKTDLVTDDNVKVSDGLITVKLP
jgi:hypothetical protein